MRWEGLFADLEAQMGREIALEEDAVVADEHRHEKGKQSLLHRIAAQGGGEELALRLADGVPLHMIIDTVGADWLGGREAHTGRSILVSARAISSVAIRSRSRSRSTAATPMSPSRIGLRMVLRDLARRRAPVSTTSAGRRMHGTIDVVGSDYLELAVHPEGTPRRRDEVTAVEWVALASVTFLVY